VLLSDGDIRAEIAAGRVGLDPFDATLLQPSSVDLRLDRHFRTFNNHIYTHIDPALQQDDLTRVVEPPPDEAFVLHPGEFVLGSTYEVISLPEDIAGRLEGKALAVDTPIPTPGGWTTMGEVRVGDDVFGVDGRPVRVVATSEVMLGRPCLDVRFSDDEVVTADAAHLWRTTTKSARKRQRPAAIVTTEEIAASLRWRNEVNHHVELADAVRCPEAELPVDPYVLGVWLGGCTGTEAEVTCGAGDEGRVGRRRGANGRDRADDSSSCALRALGLLGDEHIPVAYLRGSIGQRLALLQGLMDADGYVDVHGRCRFVTQREDLADGVAELAASLGLRPRRRKKRVTFRGVEHGVAHQVTFTPWFAVSRLERKAARLKTADRRRHLHRGIVDVQPVGSRPVRCIQVSAADGMFLVGRTFIPTHNSSLGRLGLLTHSTAGFIDPGFSGHVTLELSNVANLPIRLWPGMKVGQLCLFRLSSPAEHPYGSPVYGSRYQDQRGPTPSRSFVNFRRGLPEG
jgi:deoxycytidine triphosphate deaminase